jgi:D-sedoheptulose 7-phosphate isomerase
MDYLQDLIERYPALSAVRGEIAAGYELIEGVFAGGGKLLIAGNGGSAADAEHIVGELMKSFALPRPMGDEFSASLKAAGGLDADEMRFIADGLEGALPAIALCGHNALSSAILNDKDGTLAFAQQVVGYGVAGDGFLGISTSGNSRNVLYAAVVARARGMRVLGLTGAGGGRLARVCDVAIRVPETVTYKVQELHLPIYHALCRALEARFFM